MRELETLEVFTMHFDHWIKIKEWLTLREPPLKIISAATPSQKNSAVIDIDKPNLEMGSAHQPQNKTGFSPTGRRAV